MQLRTISVISRFIPIAIATLGISASSTFAGTNLNIGLNGKEFGDGQNFHLESSGTLDASKAYTFTLQGTLNATGDYASLDGFTLAQLATLSGAGPEILTKVKNNPSGTLPFTISSDSLFSRTVGSLSASFKISSKITSSGKVVIDINGISITAPSGPLKGKITFTDNSKLFVSVAPEMRFNLDSQNVSEDNGFVKVKVARYGYINAEAKVTYYTTDDTAIKGIDYKGKSREITFKPGEFKKTIRISIINNTVKDGKRTFMIHLKKPSKGAAIGSKADTAINIFNDDR